MPKSKKTGYPEIDEIREDLNSLKDNVIELTKHVQEDGIHRAEEASVIAKKKLAEIQANGEQGLKKMEGHVREKPAQSLAIAFAGGLLASLLLRRRG